MVHDFNLERLFYSSFKTRIHPNEIYKLGIEEVNSWQRQHRRQSNALFRIIEKYFASMFRRLQFTFQEGAIFISCVDQKLSILQEIKDSL